MTIDEHRSAPLNASKSRNLMDKTVAKCDLAH